MKKLTTRQIALNGVVAGLYAAITILTASFAYGNIQFRIADSLCVLVVLEPSLTVGLTLGCLISNIFSTVSALDIVIGTAGTLLGCLLAARVKRDWLVPVPVILANAVLVGAMLAYVLTPDALGPQVAQHILVTRHLTEELARSLGMGSLRKTAALIPGVLGQTGVESGELTAALVNFIQPSAVIVVDALAAQDYGRLGRTIQISDSGIAPGSGVQNSRKELSRRTLGIPVLSIGVPTVIDAATLAAQLTGSSCEQAHQTAMVTPREIDRLIGHSAKFIALAINKALYPELSLEEIGFLCA